MIVIARGQLESHVDVDRWKDWYVGVDLMYEE
jgi:hypothetical protein